jgi:hypothetical protein
MGSPEEQFLRARAQAHHQFAGTTPSHDAPIFGWRFSGRRDSRRREPRTENPNDGMGSQQVGRTGEVPRALNHRDRYT